MDEVNRRNTVSRVVIFLAGLYYLLPGLALLLSPLWFFENIGFFPPFNRHYLGDVGSFLLPLGLGLLLAAHRPARHASLIAVAAAASLLHAFNHAYDMLLGTESLGETLLLLVVALLLVFVAVDVRPKT